MRDLKMDELEIVSGGSRARETVERTPDAPEERRLDTTVVRARQEGSNNNAAYYAGTNNPTYGTFHIPGSIQSNGQMGYAATIVTVQGSDDDDDEDNNNADLNVADSSNELLHLAGIPGGGSNFGPLPDDESGLSIAAVKVNLGASGITASVGYEVNGDQDLWVRIDASQDIQLTPKFLAEILSKYKPGVTAGVTVPIDGDSLGNTHDIKYGGQISGNLFGVSVSASGSVAGNIGNAQLGASIGAGGYVSINITDVAASMAMSVDQLISELENATNDSFSGPRVDDDGNLDHGIIDDLNDMIPNRFDL